MPVISFDYNDLISLVGKKIKKETLVEKIPMLGADVNRVNGDEIDVEFFPNRPDLYSVEGIARAVSSIFGYKTGLRKYDVEDSNIKLIVESSIRNVRPYVVSAVVTGINITDSSNEFNKKTISLQSLMDFQEKLHITIGRNRKKVSVGIHDMKRIKPPFTYKAVDPASIRFVPLGNNEEMNLCEILQKHEKGIVFASILDGCKKYPIIIDANNQVLSFPPIINGTITKVTSETKDIFIDVTGTDFNAVNSTLNIIVTAMADRGGRIQSVKIQDGKKTIKTPNLSPTPMKLKCGDVNEAIGLNIPKKDIKTSLQRMGYGVEDSNKNKGAKKKGAKKNKSVEKDYLNVLIPAYRCDIIHNIDLIEDVAIGYGYENFSGQHPKSPTFGSRRGVEDFSDKLRLIMIGLGFQEVTTLTLSNEKDQSDFPSESGFPPESGRFARIKNPITEEHTIVRTTLIPSLLNILKINKRHNLPQKIVEIGEVVIDNANVRKIASLGISSKSGFSDIKSTVECLLKNLSIDYGIENKQHPAFINGRCASINHKGKELGYFGEIHPKTIIDFELEHPINGFEIDVNKLMEAYNSIVKQ